VNSAEHEVLWAEAAVRDLEEIAAHIAQDSPRSAAKVVGRIRRRTESLASTPEQGRVVPELRQFGLRDWRELVARPYRIVYRLSGYAVFVLAVFDGRRDLEDLLLERLLREE